MAETMSPIQCRPPNQRYWPTAVTFTVSRVELGTIGPVTFANAADHQVMVNIAASDTYYDDFNGNGLKDNLAGTVFLLNQGMTLKYFLVENTYSDIIDYGTNNIVEFNTGTGVSKGAHPDCQH
jgi:hypothetical protein